MGRIIVSANVSIDTVVEDPTGEEGTAHGGWFLRVHETDRAARAELQLEEARDATALLFGRRGYEFFASRWPQRDGALADRLTDMPKYVISRTLRNPAWNRTTVLTGDAAAEVSALRDRTAGDILVYASFQLVDELILRRLVDEVRLLVHPVALGTGRRLFEPPADIPLLRAGVRQIGTNLVLLSYTPEGPARG
ncbi:dihydrofolate reductase family protein [Microbacterium ulmi]|uniref:Deaminase n=1 Tax=Microbacterium ulmi TaxID=179095 RepID=A0A7Y2M231_9MICO|nr:dihydrofolate reductase [Microbacterium ulmi]NNH05076.1 deaminase [Microbacterium ulmi]